MNYEKIKSESERARGVREAIGHVSKFLMNDSITIDQFDQATSGIRETITSLKAENDPAAEELDEMLTAEIFEAIKNEMKDIYDSNTTENQKTKGTKEFHDRAKAVKARIIRLVEAGDPVAPQLVERFKANFPYHSDGL